MEGVGHKLVLLERKHLALEGVKQVGTFNESEVDLDTTLGYLCLKGANLHITQLNLDEGKLTVEGYISAIEFNENKMPGNKGRGLLNRILK